MTSHAVTTAGFDGWEWILIFVLVWLIFRHIDAAEERLRRDLRPREARLREIEAEADMKQWQAQMRREHRKLMRAQRRWRWASRLSYGLAAIAASSLLWFDHSGVSLILTLLAQWAVVFVVPNYTEWRLIATDWRAAADKPLDRAWLREERVQVARWWASKPWK